MQEGVAKRPGVSFWKRGRREEVEEREVDAIDRLFPFFLSFFFFQFIARERPIPRGTESKLARSRPRAGRERGARETAERKRESEKRAAVAAALVCCSFRSLSLSFPCSLFCLLFSLSLFFARQTAAQRADRPRRRSEETQSKPNGRDKRQKEGRTCFFFVFSLLIFFLLCSSRRKNNPRRKDTRKKTEAEVCSPRGENKEEKKALALCALASNLDPFSGSCAHVCRPQRLSARVSRRRACGKALETRAMATPSGANNGAEKVLPLRPRCCCSSRCWGIASAASLRASSPRPPRVEKRNEDRLCASDFRRKRYAREP